MPNSKRQSTPLLKSLSARLLVLTMAFVMLGEVLIYAPSVARFRKVYLEERVASAYLATLALQATPNRDIDAEIRDRLLANSESYNIVLRTSQRSMLVVGSKVPKVDLTYDLRDSLFLVLIKDAFETLLRDGNRVLRVIGVVPKDPGAVVEVMLDEMPLREAMYDYSKRILGLSIVISLITASLVFLSLQWLLVGPIRRITESMTAFRANPEDEATSLGPSDRDDEVGLAQRELAVMQNDLRAALKQKTRLAALGVAVAKINHDLRNTLATAMLVSDRLAGSDDPEVREIVPKLFDAIDRASKLCAQTLNFVREATPKMAPSCFALRELIDETRAGATMGIFNTGAIVMMNDTPSDLIIEADREQLYRVLVNVARNAYQAGATEVRMTARSHLDRILIDVIDNGPGLPPQAQENLFQPFSGSARKGGTGLGLVIARDVMRAHRGDINLMKTGSGGTTFCLELPAIAEPVDA